MNLARQALRNGDATTTTVTAIVAQFGLWNFGRFSVEYKALFSESPSASVVWLRGVGQISPLIQTYCRICIAEACNGMRDEFCMNKPRLVRFMTRRLATNNEYERDM
jgi:hypothetical protein